MDDLHHLPEDTVADVEAKRKRFAAWVNDPRRYATKVACDLYVAAFLLPKIGGVPLNPNSVTIPTTAHVRSKLKGEQVYGPLEAAAVHVAMEARALHWPLAFPEVMVAKGGFDVVLGNPPWERIKLQEQEFFAIRDPDIANAPNAAARGRMIKRLADSDIGSPARLLHQEFELAKRITEASSVFFTAPRSEDPTKIKLSDVSAARRYPWTGRGDVNTYALFAEHFLSLVGGKGRAGMIVPTGIATDATTAPFFGHLIERQRLASLIDFENRAGLFPAVDSRMKFSLMTFGYDVEAADFAFFLTDPTQLEDERRRFTLTPSQIARVNPNTKTAPVFRSKMDAKLTAKIYDHVPVLIEEGKGAAGNPWDIEFMAMFHMANDSGLFRTAVQLRQAGYVRNGTDWVREKGVRPDQATMALIGGRDANHLDLSSGEGGIRGERYIPLYEAKMVSFFDHRAASYGERGDDRGYRVLPLTSNEQHEDPDFELEPFYWVPEDDVRERLTDKNWNFSWLLGWKDITSSTNERTLIPSPIPVSGCGDTFLLAFPSVKQKLAGALLTANWSALVQDYTARQKVSGLHLKYNVFKQFPILPPSAYSEADIAFIVPKVLELTYTSHSMAPFARDLGYDGPSFAWDEDRRALLRADLDAWYAKAYGLSRDELRYVLDPKEVMGADYPSETFRVLQKNEIAKYGEYRTARLVLAAYDRLFASAIEPVATPIRIDPNSLPDNAWARPTVTDNSAATLAQLAALIKSMPGTTPAPRVRLAALFAMEPRYLTRRLTGLDRSAWLRLVGNEARDVAGSNVLAIAPRINAAWRDAVTQLIGMGAIIENAAAQSWTAGDRVNEFFTETWPDGRAQFVLRMMENMNVDDVRADLAAEDLQWLESNAA
jgi:hypothetical protein